MLDFRRRSHTRNYTSQREQRRLFVLVLMSGLTLLLMVKAGDPRNWRWLSQLDAPQVQHAQDATDSRLPEVKANDAPDVFVARRVSPPDPQREETKYFPGVRADYLDRVRDDTVFDASDQDGMYHLLSILRETDPKRIDEASTGTVSFAQLDKQPREYRGQIVSVNGVAHGAQRFEAPANAYDIKQYYQLWLEPTAGPSLPIVIYALELPHDFPEGMDLRAEIEVTGFFFKRWAYRAQDGIRSAPLILARTVNWERPLPARTVTHWPDATSVALGLGLVALVVMMFYRYWRDPARTYTPPADDKAIAQSLEALSHEPLTPRTDEAILGRIDDKD